MAHRARDWLVQAERDLEHYGELQSNQAIDYAREILEFARPQVA
ncbi:hypothetical protein HRbin33_01910 [bacterium HR33]|nr:hypothetical protein HRbin33_01910 [bacterium HR33]